MAALSAMPRDQDTRFFVEQQLRTRLPEGDWPPFLDPRPVELREEVVQVPKFWSFSRSSRSISTRPMTEKSI